MKTLTKLIIGALVITNAFAAQTVDTDMNFYFSVPITNNITPEGDEPWITLNFTQIESYTLITLTSNLTDGEYLSNVGLSLNPDVVNYSNINFETVSQLGYYSNPSITVGNNIYNAGGGNVFDIRINFATAKYNRFDNQDVITFKVENSYIDMFRDDDFKMIAHIQGIGEGSQSTWLTTIPEPNVMLLTMSSVGVILLLRRRY